MSLILKMEKMGREGGGRREGWRGVGGAERALAHEVA